MQLSNPAQERARTALSLEQLTKDQRKTVAVHLRNFMVAMKRQRAFDQAVAQSLERLATQPAFRARLAQLLSTKENSDAVYR